MVWEGILMDVTARKTAEQERAKLLRVWTADGWTYLPPPTGPHVIGNTIQKNPDGTYTAYWHLSDGTTRIDKLQPAQPAQPRGE